ncbi:hypothetical protein J4E85_008050 [Alternaria conjuncta]|uniref:uncharacterized protein n=1 Tax=Alternaria conjuncta TaxID=181017 RepID=UPI00221E98D9|nr:uncharacterized protein J4E85_008050 [Alternaria conjuncta]KAI4923893.1 hypothetical protein J4E85_008050 [Alternaria conjuncta]
MHVHWQSMLERRDRFFGNIIFYDYLYKTKRLPFLERNRKQVQQGHSHSQSEDQYSQTGPRFRSQWQPPSWDLLDDMISAEKSGGSFVLEVHSIRPLNAPESSQNGQSNDPARKVRNILRLTTSIKTSIVSSSTMPTCKNPPDQEATLRGFDRSEKEASIEVEPIVIDRESWYTDPTKIDDHDIHMIMLSINFETHDNVKDLYDFMGVKISDASARLSTSYGNIFDVPQGRITLPLKAAGKQLGIGLEVSMHWIPLKRDSVLTSYNRHLKSSMQPPSSYPTPPLDMEPRYKLTFVYGNDTVERSELMCPHCSKRKTTDIDDLKMHLISWHDYFDYQVFLEQVDEHGVEHWRFESEVANYRTEQRQRASDNADEPYDVRVLAPPKPFDRRRFLAGDNEFERAARLGKATRNARSKLAPSGQQVAPPPRIRKPPDQVQSRPEREKKKFIVPNPPKGITFFRSLSRRPLQPGEEISESDDELDEEWLYRWKHAEIDKANLSESARRFIKLFDDFMHEESLQSDIHVGDAIVRFARECGVRIWRENVVGEFTKKLDELLEEDIISKDVHSKALEIVSDQETNYQGANELSQRLEQLDVQNQETSGRSARLGGYIRSAPKRDRKGKGKAKVPAFDDSFDDDLADVLGDIDRSYHRALNGYLTPTTPDPDGDVDMSEAPPHIPEQPLDTPQDEDDDPPYGLCYCGQDASATPGSGIITCNDTDCIRQIFHWACAQQDTHSIIPTDKPRDWTCSDCKSDCDMAS